MSSEPTAHGDRLAGRLVDRLPESAAPIVASTAAVAALVVVSRTVLTIAGNIPFDPVSVPPALDWLVSTATPPALAAAAVAVAADTKRSTVSVGLLFIAAFTLVAAVTPAAGLASVVAVTLGGGLALAGAVGRQSTPADYRRAATVGLAAVGIALSLGGSVGIGFNGGHTLGVGASLAAVALVGFEVDPDWRSLAVGAVAGIALIGAGVVAPFITGATLLVALAVTGVSASVVAVAVAGATTAIAAGIQHRALLPVAGGCLCLTAGVPSTPERAAALVVGLTLVLCRAELTAQRGRYV